MTTATPLARWSGRARSGGRWLALALIGSLVWAALPAAAQTVEDQVQRLQRELSDLQRQVYGGAGAPAAGAGTATGLAPTQAARIELRLNQFEAELRSLTGQVEEMRFQTDSVSQRLDRLVADVDLRLQALEQGGVSPGLAEAAPAGAAAETAAQGFAASPPVTAGSSAAPGTLGTIAETDLQRFKQQQGSLSPAAPAAAGPTVSGGQVAAVPGSGSPALPGATPREKYDFAFGLLRQANYEGAEQALSAFLAEHPNDALAGNAKYWLGETYYVRGNYQQAAVTFAEGFEAYPDNPKAPDNLLKLGMSLASLGSTADACGTFQVLQQRYADASATIIQRSRQEAQRIGC
ncbi:tol-pal system protein YbgF [Pelagibius sp.]|uniref:tol-pal system protein YbgF n=1 Tax=Pelagibius sp. TaxID=1931238 RepID=UPI002610B261|nr:tol-pal system protein YbgF [Pelagibius sp.]